MSEQRHDCAICKKPCNRASTTVSLGYGAVAHLWCADEYRARVEAVRQRRQQLDAAHKHLHALMGEK